MGGPRRCVLPASYALALFAALGSLTACSVIAFAQPSEGNALPEDIPMGPPNGGLALAATLVRGEQRVALGCEAVEVKIANISKQTILVRTDNRGPFSLKVFVYDPTGRCVAPLAMNSMSWVPGPVSDGGTAGPGDRRTPLAPGALTPIWPHYLQVNGLSEQTPPGKYSVVAIAVDRSEDISSLLVSNLVTFDWPRPTE